MQTFPIGFNEIYNIGALPINLSQPTNRKCENDYIIHWNGNHQFSDIHLFEDLDNNIDTRENMEKFISSFIDSPFIALSEECILSNIEHRKDVIEYVNQTDFNDRLKLCLASIIFRCDIDNINYQCPRFNGCIRHYIQILAVFAYKFNIAEYKLEKITPFINNENYCQIVSDAGYPRNIFGISNSDFKDKYKELL